MEVGEGLREDEWIEFEMNPFGVYQEHVFGVRPGGAHPHSFKLRWDRGAGAVDIHEPVNHTKAKVHASYWHDVHHLGPDGQPLLAWNPISLYARRAEEVEWAEGEAPGRRRSEATLTYSYERQTHCDPYRGAGRVQEMLSSPASRMRRVRRARSRSTTRRRRRSPPPPSPPSPPPPPPRRRRRRRRPPRRAPSASKWT